MNARKMPMLSRALLMLCAFLLNTITVYAASSCSASSLQGRFGFKVTGTHVGLGDFALLGIFDADGSGHFTGIGSESIVGHIFQNGSFTGTYNINSQCFGSAVFVFPNGAQSNLEFVLVNNGTELLIMVTDDQTVETGTAKKQFLQDAENGQ